MKRTLLFTKTTCFTVAFLCLVFLGYSQTKTIHYENFDANNGGWTSSTESDRNGSWSYNANPIVGEGSYWSINNYNDYGINYLTRLTSPVISTSGFNNVKFYIDIRYVTQSGVDGMNIEYTTDALGLTGWVRLGNAGNGNNWYSDMDVNGIGNDVHGWSGINTEVEQSPSKFIEASISGSDVAGLNNATSLRFRINFGSDNNRNDDGVAIDNVIIKGEHITAPANPAIGPGNINGNLKLWLKANVGTNSTTDNSTVTSWSDQAYDNSANGYGTFAPKYRNDASRNINFNPVVDFSRSGSNVLKGKGGYWSTDYYVVVKTNGNSDKSTNNSQEIISGRITTENFGQDGTGLGLGRISSRFNSDNLISHMIGTYSVSSNPDSYGRSYAPPSPTNTVGGTVMILNIKSNTSVTPNVTEIYLNGKKIDTHTATTGTSGTGTPLTFSDFNNSVYQLGVGRFTLNGFLVGGVLLNTYLDGRITEVASYSTARTELEQQKIQSYLGIKNGVTLHASGSTTADNFGDVNYIDSNGDPIWDVAANTGFNYDIAGIGRDDNTVLIQKQSKSENPNTVLTIGLSDITSTNSNNPNNFGGDRNYLMWGSNNGTMSNSGINLNIDLGPTTISTSTEVVNRKWKVVEKTGIDVGTVRVNIPAATFLSGLPALGPTDAYVMVVATNSAFTTGLETVFMSTASGNQTCLYDFDGTKYITFGVAHRATKPLHITLDGLDDFVRIGNSNELPAAFSFMTWIRPNGTNTLANERTILSKKSAAGNGYQIVLQNDNRIRFEWYNDIGVLSTAITNTILPNTKWHNIAYTYTSLTLSIYIDGVFEKTVTKTRDPGTSTGTFSIGGQFITKNAINNLFKGDIDELRIWNRVLTAKEIQFIMNQEIVQSNTGTIGTIIPSTITKNDTNTLLWNNLIAYYSMNSYIGTHLDDDSVNVNRGSLVIPDKISINVQTAPMPYISDSNGLWQTPTTWKNGGNQDVPYSLSIINNTTPIDWNIVKTTHIITSSGNKTVLGLFVNSNTLSATNDSKIEVSHYLKLDGKIDLVGRSQLVQKLGSDLDATSAGSIKRDQQGQANKFNYNYWSAPVGRINDTTNNNNFTVAEVLKDGTNPAAPGTITWINGYDGATTPFSLARYWIYKFDSNLNASDYANWTQIGETGTLQAGKGFTLKGPGTSGTQNLSFSGKPNNGTITNTIGSDQLLLVGNPYPSALDADQFIMDNINSIETSTTNPAIDGALYFWEHYSTNNSHNLAAYQGGYGIRNLSGGVAPSATGVDFISGTGSSSKLDPKRYIPVGQGFFVIGKIGSGGTVTFNNSQRDFVKEDSVGLSQTLYRIPETPKDSNHWTDNSNARIENDTHKKIRLGFNVIDKTFHRQVLLAFMEERANAEMNDGYDAYNIDGSPNDLYLLNGENRLAIQGEGYFDQEASFPIGVRTEAAGKVSFGIDALENFDENQNIFIYDKETDTYNSLKNTLYEVDLPEGYVTDRFALRFTDKSLVVQDQVYENAITVFFTRSNNVLNITNSTNDNTVLSVSLYNIQGKLMEEWEVADKEQTNMKIQIQDKEAEVYVVKLKTSKGIISKKIIVK
ncbi:LamG-like jellyroll fold domain-containing protein [Flavobacterium sp. RSP15]|uniref:LamG-like jellyroll fold domain-containing protein n=1 Tax=Flavobacterium sp. RSP15 TaxID=2497485 RepID=UPI000F828B5C|nr:LamG-like jellyroll fold domain-containing protein [Flavobacterium sp. RSP15]RTY87204.1 T9SS type A sorting domain-containing protein [Flavobacterium sp. RSP15]